MANENKTPHSHFTDGLVWNADLTLEEFNEATKKRNAEIEAARANRPRTALLEREIMIAVTGLYILILGGFAMFHLYGAYYLDTQEDEPVAAAQHGHEAGEVR